MTRLAAALLEVGAMGLLLALLAMVRTNAARLPATIPVHFGITGEPDSWGSRRMIWIVPGAAGLLYAMTTVASLAAPGVSPLWMALLKTEMLAVFLIIARDQIRVATHETERLGPAIWVALALTLITAFAGPLFR